MFWLSLTLSLVVFWCHSAKGKLSYQKYFHIPSDYCFGNVSDLLFCTIHFSWACNKPVSYSLEHSAEVEVLDRLQYSIGNVPIQRKRISILDCQVLKTTEINILYLNGTRILYLENIIIQIQFLFVKQLILHVSFILFKIPHNS